MSRPGTDIHPDQVHPLPSGKYGSYIPEPSRDEGEPVVQVAEWIDSVQQWHPTPARHYASTLLGKDDYSSHPGKPVTGRLSIDHGQGWALDEADTTAHVAFAAAAWLIAHEEIVPGTFARRDDDYRARF
jgi:hypothetical protein